MNEDIIYLDNNASTPIDPRVLSILNRASTELYGNASSNYHPLGKVAQDALNDAREQIKKYLHAEDFQVIFTSGATESLNMAILGLHPSRVVVGTTEHKAVLETCRWLSRYNGTEILRFAVNDEGKAIIADLEIALEKPSSLIAAMLANNETGAIHPIPEIARVATKKKVPLLCDLTQAVGKIPVRLDQLGPDLAVLSSHKIYGPKGVGALLYRQDTLSGRLRPILHGGGQEFGLRPGTENVPAIIAFTKALELAIAEQAVDAERLKAMRDTFESRLCERTAGVIINGPKVDRLPNTSNFSIADVEVEEVMEVGEGLAISTGSACATQTRSGSYVLRAMGIPDTLASNSLRISFGRFNTEEQSPIAAKVISDAVHRLRSSKMRERKNDSEKQ
jgi:cysteine desulfurase